MVDAIVSAVVEELTSMVFSSIKEEVKLVTGVNDEIKKLKRNFEYIQAFLDDAEEQQEKQAAVKKWLFDLKHVSYDTDDVLDEWKTWIQTSQLHHQHQSSLDDPNPLLKKVLSVFRCICFTKRDVGRRHVVAHKITEIQQRLDDIARVRCQLNLTQTTGKHIERNVTTTSFIDPEKVKGRVEEKNMVKSMILDGESKLHIISLVGLGGIGKTTLAKLIFNDNQIQAHFEKKAWVCVSEPFDEMRIAKAILESLDKPSTQDLKELENVLKEVRAILNGKRFLLILDDVWNEDRRKWEELEHSLKCGSLGSTILVTTRKQDVALAMGCSDESIHTIGGLTSDECWSIISEIALVKGERKDELEGTGKKIAAKCKGLPLIAVTIGGALRSKKSEEEWLSILNSEDWDSKSEKVLGPLKLSYYDLPLPLKQCFLYCAIFPKDSKIEKKRLIGMWMSQGYLKGKEKDEELEMVGETYFKNLVARSLLQPVFDYLVRDYSDDACMLHDMVSDLAQTLAKHECLMMEVLNDAESSKNSLHEDTRHLTLVIGKNGLFPTSVYNLKKLRSLIIQIRGISKTPFAIASLEGIFDHLTCLRTLHLRRCGIRGVPSSISRLFHLRWLDLSNNTNLEKLPDSLCECYNLQTLYLEYCFNLGELPQEIGKLINLQTLYLTRCSNLVELPQEIGKLINLRTLNIEQCLKLVQLPQEIGKLINLQTLNLEQCLNLVKLPQEIEKLINLQKLYLGYCSNLVELPQGIGRLINLMYLDIRHCDKIKCFPKSIGNLWHLKELSVERTKENVGNVFYVGVQENEASVIDLEKLNNLRGGLWIKGLGNVRKKEEARAAQLKKKKNITGLDLDFEGDDEVEDKEELLEAVEPPSGLERLEIHGYNGKRVLPKWIMKLNLLRKIKIYSCENCEELPPLGRLPCLEELILKGMRMKKVGVEFMGIEKEEEEEEEEEKEDLSSTSTSTSLVAFPKLKELEFSGFSKWEEWEDIDEWLMDRIKKDNDNDQKKKKKIVTVMPCLEKLVIKSCPKLKTVLPRWMMKLNLLRYLKIENCENCEVLPPLGRLPCLENLSLWNMGVKRVGVEFMGIGKEEEEEELSSTSTSLVAFPKLKELYFRGFSEWEEIDEWLMEKIKKDNNNQKKQTVTVMPCLKELRMYFCPKLKTLPYHLLSPTITPRLQQLYICGCDVLRQQIDRDKLSHIPQLDIL